MKVNMQGQVISHNGIAYGPGLVSVDRETAKVLQKARDGAIKRTEEELNRLRPTGVVTGVVNPAGPVIPPPVEEEDEDEETEDDEVGTETDLDDEEIEASINERAAYIVKNATREEMNAMAGELGIANPESYGTKAELADIIARSEHQREEDDDEDDEDEDEE